MATRISSEVENEETIARSRNKVLLEQARAVVTSDTEFLELALSGLALDDDFGVRLARRKGIIPAEIDLGI